jgi:hypothetical protein
MDTVNIAFSGKIKTNKVLCFGEDNPYLLIERARSLENKNLDATEKKV